MKKLFLSLASLFLIISLIFVSCGPSKKLTVAQNRVNKLKTDSVNTHSQLKQCNIQVDNLNEKNRYLQTENTSVQGNLKDITAESTMTIADQAKRLKDFQSVVQSQKGVMSKLKSSIAAALMNYKTDELSVFIKDGNVYVSLAEKLLFKSGSAVVDPKGKEALQSLANILKSTKDITVLIEGHTDNVPIKTQLFKDNWDLSTARATSIVRVLTQDYGFDANRITASGRGKFHPVKTNDTVDGRAGNRRTEIILSPDLKELYSLLDK